MKRWIPFVKSPPLVSVIRLQGSIASGGVRGNNLNDAALSPLIEKAFRRGRPNAVALLINSPGGSPVQSSLIAGRIRRLSEERKVPVFAFVEDVAASGGYWLAAAADEIWIDASSIVGSIGVISAGFGFQDLIAQYGIERRVHTAGKSKSVLDPFKPEKATDVKHLNSLLQQMHETFIALVKDRRGDRLSENADLFTGKFWIGEVGVDLGLADGLGHLVPVMKDKLGEHTKFVMYERKRSMFQRFGASMAGGVVGEIEERIEYSRFGL